MNKHLPPTPVPQAFLIDRDHDGIKDGQELLQGLNPNYPDTDQDGVDDLVEKRQHSNPRVKQSKPSVDLNSSSLKLQYTRILCQIHGWHSSNNSWQIFCQDLEQMGDKLKEIYGRNWDLNVAKQALLEKFEENEISYLLTQSPYLKTTVSLSLTQKIDYANTVVSEILTQGEKQHSERAKSISEESRTRR